MDLSQRPEHVDLADVVYQSVQRPLYIHFAFGTQGESLHVFMHTDVRKNRFYNTQSSGIDLLARFAVNLGFHQIDQVRLTRVHLNGEIPARSIRLAQTARAQRAGRAIFGASLVDVIRVVPVDLVVGMTFQFFAVRTTIDLPAFIIGKISRAERTGLGVCLLLVLETLLLGTPSCVRRREALVALTELDIGNVRVHFFFFANLQALERMIVAVGS